MIFEGERVKALVTGASSRVILCSPFIKAKVFAIILGAVPPGVPVQVVTRWRPDEIAAGLSDLEVFDIAKERANTQLCLLHSLHAKLYLADNDCLVGSANLTAAALGWRPNANVEILVPAKRSDADVSVLLDRLTHSIPATFQLREEMAKLAAALDKPQFDESQDISSEFSERATMPWLPRCAVPEKLYEIYQDPDTPIAVESTRRDALMDLQDLAPPRRLNSKDFAAYVAESLSQIPSFQEILTKIPSGMTDSKGIEAIATLRQELSRTDASKQWSIVREWISLFFKDKFEVAPQTFVVRLKSR